MNIRVINTRVLLSLGFLAIAVPTSMGNADPIERNASSFLLLGFDRRSIKILTGSLSFLRMAELAQATAAPKA